MMGKMFMFVLEAVSTFNLLALPPQSPPLAAEVDHACEILSPMMDLEGNHDRKSSKKEGCMTYSPHYDALRGQRSWICCDHFVTMKEGQEKTQSQNQSFNIELTVYPVSGLPVMIKINPILNSICHYTL